MKVEEEYQDVLQNIEALVVQHYNEYPETTDYSVERVYETLKVNYTAELRGREPREIPLSPEEKELFTMLEQICEFRLGRAAFETEEEFDEKDIRISAITVEEMLLVIKKLLSSVKFWTKRNGRQGYLNYIIQFII